MAPLRQGKIPKERNTEVIYFTCPNPLKKNCSPASRSSSARRPRKKAGALFFKVSDKGAVSVYGMGRFPVTLYYEQWQRLLAAADELRSFLEENKSRLKLKEEANPGAQ